MTQFAVGKHAIGICDRCGFQYPLRELRKETVNSFVTDLKVCSQCWDPDQPQNKLGRVDFTDAQAVRDPRPDKSAAESRSLSARNPVRGMIMIASLGKAHAS